jgi:hypothetical protein
MDLLRVLSIQLGFFSPPCVWSRQQGQRNSKRNVGPTVSGCLTLRLDDNTSHVAVAWLISATLPSANHA